MKSYNRKILCCWVT